MKEFLGNDFLLHSDLAVNLFDQVKDLAIIDYHCHLDPKEIAENKRFRNITEIWLGGDHYKWRLMRANGIPEEYITGSAPDFEKFQKWAETIENCIGNPLYHWTHLELRRYFDYKGLLSGETAKDVWEHCNEIISSDDFTVWNIFKKFNVESLCTTDDPVDNLEYHDRIRESGIPTKVSPTFRPSKAFAIDSPGFLAYIQELSQAADVSIQDYHSVKTALYRRIDAFHEKGCRLSDNALDPPVFAKYNEPSDAVVKALRGEALSAEEINQYKAALFIDLGKKYNELDWAMQIHMNASRNNNTRAFAAVGADTGYDSILDVPVVNPLSRLLDGLAKTGQLPKTVLYTLNPSADDAVAAMAGNFQGGIKGKIQYGSAWWFNDTKSGMEKQMSTLANHGILANFIGMLTDSRSFLSYTRHEYFRRIMANLLAEWVIRGEFPNDFGKLSTIAKGIAYQNAKEYFSY